MFVLLFQPDILGQGPKAVDSILEYGVMGAMVVILLFAVRFLYRRQEKNMAAVAERNSKERQEWRETAKAERDEWREQDNQKFEALKEQHNTTLDVVKKNTDALTALASVFDERIPKLTDRTQRRRR